MAGNNNGRLTNAIGESLSPAAIKLTVPDAVPAEFRRWVWAGGRKLKGLIRRWEAEAPLYGGGPN